MDSDTPMVTTAFKTRIHLNNKQKAKFVQWARARRTAYNYALNLCLIYLEECERLGKDNMLLGKLYDFKKFFNASKYPLGLERKTKAEPLIGTGINRWMSWEKVPGSVTSIAIRDDLKNAWLRCFQNLSNQPKFQSLFRHVSFTVSSGNIPQNKIHRDCIELPQKLGIAKLGDGIPYSNYSTNNVAFTREADKWYVSFTLKVPADDYYRHRQNKQDSVGVDIGVNIYAATSDGINYYAPEKLKKLEQRKSYINKQIGKTLHKNLIIAVSQCDRCSPIVTGMHKQKNLCHDCRQRFFPLKNSRKITKLRASVARITAKQAAIRENMAHQLTTELVSSYHNISIEDLQVKNMTASAKGDTDNPGSKVKQKSGLNRSLLNVAPNRFRLLLTYKADKYGSNLLLKPPHYTSQQCAACGHTSPDNRQTQALFVCQECGYQNNADTNAAINIRDK